MHEIVIFIYCLIKLHQPQSLSQPAAAASQSYIPTISNSSQHPAKRDDNLADNIKKRNEVNLFLMMMMMMIVFLAFL